MFRKKRKKFDALYSEPAEVIKVNQNYTYRIRFADGKEETKSLKWLKPSTNNSCLELTVHSEERRTEDHQCNSGF